ncbi:Cytochrome bd ubiquinol oxidase subunit 1 [Candidatus Hepatincola sp. Pdp]
MLIESTDLSRFQFAYTTFVHFLFVPLTLGLTLLMAIMETIYVKTNKAIYKDMVRFWGTIFAINFVLGVLTGIPMEFQFGTNWSSYSHYVGDVLGIPLVIEGLIAFFLEGTFIVLFFYGWGKLSKKKHLMITWLLFLGSNFSALWILIANGWMQSPVGAYFNLDTMRMEMSSFVDLIFNPAAQLKFLHTLMASYTLGAIFVIAISSYYLLKNRHIEFAKRSIMVAVVVGLLSTLVSLGSGHEKGLVIYNTQKSKIAAFEGVWNTEQQAGFRVVAWPNQKKKQNDFEIVIPKLLTILNGTPIEGTNDIIKDNEIKIRTGIKVYVALQKHKQNPNNSTKKYLQDNIQYLGYALLLHRITNDIPNATEQEIKITATNSVPNTFPLFFAFRLMVGLGLLFLIYFVGHYYIVLKNKITDYKWLSAMSLCMLPLPWIAIHTGWFIAEYGRQPWVIQDILPTFKGASKLLVSTVSFSLIGFMVLYTGLIIIDVFLIVRQVKKGPNN